MYVYTNCHLLKTFVNKNVSQGHDTVILLLYFFLTQQICPKAGNK